VSIVTIEEKCKFVSSTDVDTSAAIRFYAEKSAYGQDVIEITHGDALMGYDPIHFKDVREFKTFLKMLMRFDERL
jgi:hypothetical protein